MQFRATSALMGLLYSQIEQFPGDHKREPWSGSTVYAKLAALPGKGGTIEIDDAERKELRSLLDSIAGPYGWDTITPGERTTGRAALRQLPA